MGSETTLTNSLNIIKREPESCETGPPPPAPIRNEKLNIKNNNLCIK